MNYIRHASKLFSVQSYTANYSIKTVFHSVRSLANHSKNMAMDKIIAIGQMRSTNDKIANRQQVQQIVEKAAQKNASVRWV